MTSSILGSAVEAAVRAIVRDEVERALAGLGVKTTALLYTSVALPPRTSRRVFHETCRSGVVGGAAKTGRSWSCSATAWQKARGREAVVSGLRLVGGTDIDALVAESLIASGVRS